MIEILDERQTIAHKLNHTAQTRHGDYSGYVGKLYRTPEFLEGFLVPSDDVSVDFSVSTAQNLQSIDEVTITSQDAAPITISSGHGLPYFRVNHETIGLAPKNATTESLLSLLPLSALTKITTNRAILGIAALSPTSVEYLEFRAAAERDEFLGKIVLRKIETTDDSIETLEISKYFPHPSGKSIGTHLLLTESLSRRQESESPQQTNHEFDMNISINQDLASVMDDADTFIEFIQDGNDATITLSSSNMESVRAPETKKVSLPGIKRRHMEDILDVLDVLRRARL